MHATFRSAAPARLGAAAALLLWAALPAAAQERVDTAMAARIRAEALGPRSRVMETAVTLSDILGPRLAGTPGYRAAAGWARERLASFGATAVLEPWGRRRAGWELQRFSAEMTAPRYLRLHALPKAYSPPTAGTVSGTPVLAMVSDTGDFARYRGRLRGRIVLNGGTQMRGDSRFDSGATRRTPAELDSLARLTEPGSPATYWEESDDWAASLATRRRVAEFFREEGAAAVLEPSRHPDVLQAASYNAYDTDASRFVPAMIVARGDYDQLVRLLQHGDSVRLELSIASRRNEGDTTGYNVIGEIPGSDPRLAPEVVMLGGHFDSWHAGTGATDNAAGSAVAMEVLRILKAVDARPRRTVRVALWDGEEQEDYFGSMGYVRRHFGDPATMRLLPAHARLSAYFNLDTGTGRIRGFELQGNAAARPVLAAYLAPVADLGAGTLTLARSGATDHMPFVAVGLPAFNALQDPVDYDTRTHHTELDVAGALVEDDLKQAAAVLATVVLGVANRDERMPRLPLPAPRGR